MPEKEDNRRRILFVCTGNACRSQIAEAWATALKSDCIDAYSAGTHPAGLVSTRVQEVMNEAGIDMSGHWSKPIAEWDALVFDDVVTLCDYARDHCPAFPDGVRHIHHPLPDPMGILGSDQKTLDAFRRTRDRIKAFVLTLPDPPTE